MKTKKRDNLIALYRELNAALDAAQAAVNALRAQVNALGVELGEGELTDEMSRLTALLLHKLVRATADTERISLGEIRLAYLDLLSRDAMLRSLAETQGFNDSPNHDHVWRVLRRALTQAATRAVNLQGRIFLCGIKLKDEN